MATVYFTKPVTSDLRADVLAYLRDAINSQARMFEGDTLVSAPTNAIRYIAANSRFEKWNGAVWNPLDIIGNLVVSGVFSFTGRQVINGPASNDALALVAGAAGWAATFYDSAATNYISFTPAAASQIAANGDLLLVTDGATALRLDAAQNAGFGGVTPSATHSSERTIELGMRGNGLMSSTTSAQAILTGNAIYDGAWKYGGANAVAWMLDMGSSDRFSIYRAASGTSGAAITWTGKFTVGASYGVSIGDFAPNTWASTYPGLEIGRGGNGIYGGSTTTELGLTSNMWFDGSNWKYSTTNPGLIFALSGGLTSLYTCASGTAGTTASPVQKFQINTYGNMSLGSFAPSAHNARGTNIEFNQPGNYIGGGTGFLEMTQNAYYDGTGWKRIAAAGVGVLQVLGEQLIFYGDVTGTAGSYTSSLATCFSVQKNYSLSLQNASPQAGTGITFPATPSAVTNANTLDDYAEGTWSPATSTSGLAVSAVYGSQWVKIGRKVFAQCYIQFNNTSGAPITTFNLTNLPYACNNTVYGFADIHYPGYGWTAYGYVQVSSQYANLAFGSGSLATGNTSIMATFIYDVTYG